MKKHFFIYNLLLLTVLILFTTCYDPVFFRVAAEVEPVEPLIKGSPTNIVAFKGAVYVASGNVLYQYTGTTRGSSEPKWYTARKFKDEIILQVASTEKFLYILYYKAGAPDRKTIEKMDETGAWTPVSVNTVSYNIIQNIYSADDTLFISAANAESYSFFYLSDAGADGLLGSGDIKGAAYDGTDYYICTKEGVIYKIDTAMTTTKNSESSLEFTGLINLENNNKTIAVITRDGVLYTVNKAGGVPNKLNISIKNDRSEGRYSTGALAIWRDKSNTPRLLLAGRQDALKYSTDSGYTYGYMELQLNAAGPVGDFNEPGRSNVTSDPDNDQFKSTIGKYPVSYIFQTPIYIDSNMRLFASTQKNGVWSYKTRNGVPQWNAEADDDP